MNSIMVGDKNKNKNDVCGINETNKKNIKKDTKKSL